MTDKPIDRSIEQATEDSAPNKIQAESGADNANSFQAPTLVKILPPEKTKEERDWEAKKEEADAKFERWTKRIAIVTIAIGILQLIVYTYQGYWLRRTVRTMDDTATRQLRAYVDINSGQILHPLDNTKRRLAVEVKNFGQTPAYHFQVEMSWVVREFPLTSDLDKAISAENRSIETLGPGRTSFIFLPIIYNTTVEGEINARRSAIYIRGFITYKDAFGNDRESSFRFTCSGDALATGTLGADQQGNHST
ncbi:hypothetical protein GCM10011611_31030 [Aliidongia dinghuensis]|uniref:Uncharacterized protein n=1 Tax=Aliidongia dinghuensis TaxID=1867774 RepID=A0A8J2YU97_9PROT|nr:hypothetical protein [Aliidongia dinghuensis]GGF22773.1 hypothetical protein GCM10011611_31030 [Aliidongia dinghuensis]